MKHVVCWDIYSFCCVFNGEHAAWFILHVEDFDELLSTCVWFYFCFALMIELRGLKKCTLCMHMGNRIWCVVCLELNVWFPSYMPLGWEFKRKSQRRWASEGARLALMLRLVVTFLSFLYIRGPPLLDSLLLYTPCMCGFPFYINKLLISSISKRF